MSNPQRRRPNSASPIKLIPVVEEVRTASTVVSHAQPEKPQPIVDQQSAPTAQPAAVQNSDADEKKPVTLNIRIGLKKEAETAVLRTAGYSNGYSSFTALVEGALERELQRLSEEFNSGEPFPRNSGAFRQGRPIGS